MPFPTPNQQHQNIKISTDHCSLSTFTAVSLLSIIIWRNNWRMVAHKFMALSNGNMPECGA